MHTGRGPHLQHPVQDSKKITYNMSGLTQNRRAAWKHFLLLRLSLQWKMGVGKIGIHLVYFGSQA